MTVLCFDQSRHQDHPVAILNLFLRAAAADRRTESRISTLSAAVAHP